MKLTKQRIKEIIKEELEAMNEEPVDEAVLQEGDILSNLPAVMDAITKMATDPYTGPLIAAVIAGMPIMAAIEKHLLSKLPQDREEERGDM